MIHRFRKITDQFYRGSAPSPQDVEQLKKELGIKKIVSLDAHAAHAIDRTCKLLGIKHVVLPIEMDNLKTSLLAFLKHDLKKLFLEGGPTYVHCAAGKDRTGLAVALVQCKYFGKDPEDAIEEAQSLGMGIGVDPNIINLFKKIIRNCKPSKDNNDADIVSNEREYISDNRSGALDEAHQGSFAPYLSQTKQNPMDSVYNPLSDQDDTRQNYDPNKSIKKHDNKNVVPMVGVFDSDAGIQGAGPTEQVGSQYV